MSTLPDIAGRHVVDDRDAGLRLDKWAASAAGITRVRARALIESGAVACGGAARRDPSCKVKPGEAYDIVVPPPAPAGAEAEAIPLDIVHEDHSLIVVDKPAGMVVHPAAGHGAGTLVNALLAHCGASLSGVGGAARPGIVHRIDKDTSGLLVIAKTDAAHQGLAAQFAAHDIERAYEAIAVGAPRPGVGVIDRPLARSKQDRTKMAVVRDVEGDEEGALPDGVRRAVTHYRMLDSFGRGRARLPGDALASRIECRLETGRTHQIRVHLAAIGHPIVGDPVYGRGPGLAGLKSGDAAADAALAALRNFKRQALHARVLGFVHPVTGESLRFEAEPPADFRELSAALKAL